jgi:calcineurin-like phosphoesterase family protein
VSSGRRRLEASLLCGVIAAERVTHVVHLGDLVDCGLQSAESHLQQVLDELATLPVPIWLIGGNHGRNFFEFVGRREHPAKQMVSVSSWRTTWVMITGFPFVHWIKEAVSPAIDPKVDWLVTGHCHIQFISTECKIACVGQFSPEINAYSYAVLEVGETVALFIKSSI